MKTPDNSFDQRSRQQRSISYVRIRSNHLQYIIVVVATLADTFIPYWLFFVASGAVFPLLMLGTGTSLTEQDAASLRLLMIPVVIAAATVSALWLRPMAALLLRHPPLILLLLWIWTSAAWSVAVDVSLRRALALTAYTLLAIWLVVRYQPAEVLRRLAFALLVLLLLCVASAVFLPGLATMPGGEGFRGIYTHKNSLGQTLAISVIVFIVCLHHRLIRRWLSLVGLLLAIALLIPSRSATAVVLTCLTVLCQLALTSLRLGRLLAAALLAFAAGTTILGFTAAIFYPAPVFYLLGRDMTLTGRVELWRYALQMISEKPVAGYGYDAFWSNEDLASRFWQAFGWEVLNAHNGYLDITLGIGIVGLALLLAFVLRSLIRSTSIRRLPLPVSVHFAILYLPMYLLRNVVEYDLTNSWSWVLVVLAAFWVEKAARRERADKSPLILKDGPSPPVPH